MEANKVRLTDQMSQSLLALADTQVVFAFIDGKARLRPFHLLLFLTWILHAQAIRLNPHPGPRVTILKVEHGHQKNESDDRQDSGEDNIGVQSSRQHNKD